MAEVKYRAYAFIDGKLRGEVPNTMFEVKPSAPTPMPKIEKGILELLESDGIRQLEEEFLSKYPKLLAPENEMPKKTKSPITNRERAIFRAATRNSYELTEAEVDQMITEELDGVDVDAMHKEQLKRDKGEADDE